MQRTTPKIKAETLLKKSAEKVPVRKFKGVHNEVIKCLQKIKMYCMGKSIDIKRVNEDFKKKKTLKTEDCFGAVISSVKLDDSEDFVDMKVSHFLNFKPFLDIQKTKSKKLKYLFIFPQAGLVLWNFSPQEEKFILKLFKKYVNEPLEIPTVNNLQYVEPIDRENFVDYIEKNYIQDGILFLDSHKFDEKLAVSTACCQNVRLIYLRNDMQKFILRKAQQKQTFIKKSLTSYNSLQKNYKDTMSIYLKRIDYIDDIDTAYSCSYLYENDRYYHRYKSCSLYFDLAERVEKFNNKSDLLTQMYIDKTGESSFVMEKYLYMMFFIWIGLQIFVYAIEMILDVVGANNHNEGHRRVKGPISSLYKLFQWRFS